MTSAVGVNAGILVHATAAALGLSALLVSSSVAFTAVKLVGAAFLLYLGVRTIIDARRPTRDPVTDARRLPSMRMSRSPFWQGFWSNVLNPKVALLFMSLLPQFLDRGDPVVAKTLFLSGCSSRWGSSGCSSTRRSPLAWRGSSAASACAGASSSSAG